MRFDEAQKIVDDWVKPTKVGYFPPMELLVQMTEEVGEIAREIKHLHGVKKKKTPDEGKESLTVELGDLLFAIICMANAHGISLEEAITKTIDKYNMRDANRWEKKE